MTHKLACAQCRRASRPSASRSSTSRISPPRSPKLARSSSAGAGSPHRSPSAMGVTTATTWRPATIRVPSCSTRAPRCECCRLSSVRECEGECPDGCFSQFAHSTGNRSTSPSLLRGPTRRPVMYSYSTSCSVPEQPVVRGVEEAMSPHQMRGRHLTVASLSLYIYQKSNNYLRPFVDP